MNQDADSYVTLSVAIARPFVPTAALAMAAAKLLEAGKKPLSPAAKRKRKKKGEEERPATPPLRYELYARMVIIMDYGKTTLLKRLLALVTEQNAKALNLDPSQARAISSLELTDAQRANARLDYITGFIVMDRVARIIVVEGLREGAMRTLAEVVGVGARRGSKSFRVLFHPEVGFSRRLYGAFNLTLKQIKLRQPTLEGLTQRPDLCLPMGGGQEVAPGFHALAAMKRAERIQQLKGEGSFPTAENILLIETQYGDFISNEELLGKVIDGA